MCVILFFKLCVNIVYISLCMIYSTIKNVKTKREKEGKIFKDGKENKIHILRITYSLLGQVCVSGLLSDEGGNKQEAGKHFRNSRFWELSC